MKKTEHFRIYLLSYIFVEFCVFLFHIITGVKWSIFLASQYMIPAVALVIFLIIEGFISHDSMQKNSKETEKKQ